MNIKENLEEILWKHKLWILGDRDGERAKICFADLSHMSLRGADLRCASLYQTNLVGADLTLTNLENASLYKSDLSNASLQYAKMLNADLKYVNLSGADLSGAEGLLSAIDYMKNFECTNDGYIVYKCFNGIFPTPYKWDIAIGSVIEEEVNPNRTDVCGCGINVAPLDWVRDHYPQKPVYKLLIRWEWLAGVVVPYNTDGKIRCARAEIIERVN